MHNMCKASNIILVEQKQKTMPDRLELIFNGPSDHFIAFIAKLMKQPVALKECCSLVVPRKNQTIRMYIITSNCTALDFYE